MLIRKKNIMLFSIKLHWHYLKVLEKSEGTIKNEQSRDTGNIKHKTRMETNKRRRRKTCGIDYMSVK